MFSWVTARETARERETKKRPAQTDWKFVRIRKRERERRNIESFSTVFSGCKMNKEKEREGGRTVHENGPSSCLRKL